MPSLLWPQDGSTSAHNNFWSPREFVPGITVSVLLRKQMSEQDTVKLIFSNNFLRRLRHPQICSVQTIHPLLNAPVVRTFLPCRTSTGTRPSMSNSGPLTSSCQLQCEFSELKTTFQVCFRAFGELVRYFLAVSCWQSKDFVKLVKAGLAKLENWIICENTETYLGVSIWRNIISSCDCARVLFPLSKVRQ